MPRKYVIYYLVLTALVFFLLLIIASRMTLSATGPAKEVDTAATAVL